MKVTRKGDLYHTNGELPALGQVVPNFELWNTEDQVISLKNLEGRVSVISVVPDINTRVCDLQTKAFHHKMAQEPELQLITISKNSKEEFLSWCSANDVKMDMLTDKDFAFGKAYGIYLDAFSADYRCVLVLDKDNILRYVGLKEEMTDEPDYDAAIHAALALL